MKTVRRLPLHRKFIYSAIILCGFLGFLELSLRAIKVGQPPSIGTLKFGYETGVPLFDSDGIEQEGVVYQDMPLFERHRELLWQPIANSPFTGPHGLRKPEPDWQVDTDDAFTVLILGDSCSFLGQTPYAARLAGLIQKPNQVVRVYNASCPGYSSAQGLLRLRQFEELKPDLVVVYFGWNDHWRSLNGCTDRELFERNRWIASTQTLLGNFHVYWMFYSWAAPSTVARRTTEVVHTDRDKDAPVRVPPEEYRSNLNAIAERAASWNGRVLYLTAPTAFENQKMPEWADKFFGDFYQMSPLQVADIPAAHRRYNQQVRGLVQSQPNAVLCDLETPLSKDAANFRTDCIHLSEEGHRQAAELVAEQIGLISKRP